MIASTVLVDLRACQFNGDRGIPAYAQSLTAELVRRPSGIRWLLLQDPRWPQPPRAAELAARASWCTIADLEGPQAARVDAVLTGCFFLPHHGCDAGYLLPACLRRQQPRRLGIVYDLVPLLFPDRYLANERVRRQYHDALGLLRRSDHLFAISHASRRDVIRHAAVDPARVDCIYGDIDHRKRTLMAVSAAATARTPGRFGLTGPFCICVGGDDWRKNMETTVRAFARFRRDHPGHQLAIVCRLPDRRIADLQKVAREEGMPSGALVCTGYISDEDLVALLQHAEMLVYPSLYEGLGLPVLEAYGCGTPAVGSASSSVAELVLPELGCDPREPDSIAAAMGRLAGHPALRERSLAFGRRLLAEELGWDRAADRVLERLAARRPRPPRPPDGRHRLAVVGALPPARTGIAPYTLRHLQDRRWRTTFYEAGSALRPAPPAGLLATSQVVPTEVLPVAVERGRHDTVIFVLGNSAHHVDVLEAMIRSRGGGPRRLAYLHEAAIEGLCRGWLGPEADRLPASDAGDSPVPWIRKAIAERPAMGSCLRFLAERAELDGLLVNSEACRDLIRAALGPLADRWTIDVAFLPIVCPAATADRPPPAAAGRPLRIGSFGMAGDTKRLDLFTQAAALLARQRPVELVIAGWEARRYCRRLTIPAEIRREVLDAPDDETLAAAMTSVHVAVQLRWPTFGESSGVVNQLLGFRTPLVVAEVGSFADLPDGVATFVPADCSAEALARAIVTAADRPLAPDRHDAFLATRSPEAFAARIAEILAAESPAANATGRADNSRGPLLRSPHVRRPAGAAAAARES